MTFRLGDTVKVAVRAHAGHHRTPDYLKGRRGTISRVHGSFRNPETRAYGGDGEPRLRLYLVEFAQSELRSDGARTRGRLYADLFEHWLEPAP
jgi:nitrile hydratase